MHNELGAGFNEKVYENALMVALKKSGIEAARQVPFRVYFETILVGEYIADLVVDGLVVVELKACEALTSAHRAQCVNYLKASGLGVGLLFNFGSHRLEVRRVVRRQPVAAQAVQAAA